MIRLECVQGQHSFNLISGDLMMPFTGSFNMASGVLWSEEFEIHSIGGFGSNKSLKILFCVSLEGGPGPCPKAALLFLACSSLVFASSPFPYHQNVESVL